MKKYFLILLFVFSIVSCGNNKSYETKVSNIVFRVETIEIEDGFGYSVFVNGKKVIEQKNIPVIGENRVFKTSDDALKVGKLVVEKMTQSTDLPSLTKEELKALGVIE